MEMKSFANDKFGPGGETAAPKKIARKSTAASRKRETKYGVNHDDSVCSIEIYEVVGNLQEHLKAAGMTGQGQNSKNKVCEDSIVIGNEVLLRLTNTKDPLNRTKEQKFLDLACMIQAEKAAKRKYMPFLGKRPPPKTPYATITSSKMIIREAPRVSAVSGNTGVGIDKQSDVPDTQECEYLMYHGHEETVTDSCSSPKKADDDNDKETEKEKLVDEVSATEEVPKEGAAGGKIDGVVEVNGSGTGTNNGSSVTEKNTENNTENKGKEDEQDVPDKAPDEVPDEVPEEGPNEVPVEVKNEFPDEVPVDKILQGEEIDLVNEVEEVVVSSGSAWDNEDQPRTEFYGTTGNIDEDDEDEDDDLIGELKINEAGSLEFVKKFKGDTAAGNGTTVDIRDGKTGDKAGEEDKGAIQDEEIGSVAGEVIIGEGNKRKRIRKGEETKKLNPKKRKVEKSKKNDFSDGKGKGKSNGDKGAKRDSAKSSSSICDQSTLEETIDRVASGHLSLPFIENLRGEIRSLSRGDLEELIVQKLCEVITERSAVGHLRKRAEALEKNQERWKEKVLSLTKQIKEMDMVMKNYLSEVRRHHTEKSFQMIAPLRVTRSVGLQVSFTSTPSKLAKTMPKCSGDSHHGREKGGKHSNRSVHVSQPPNKKIPILPTTSSKKPLVIDSKNKFSTKSGLTITLQPASSSSETQLATKPIQIQQPKLSILPATDSPSTSLIDLTGDDDRQLEVTGPVTSPQTLTVGPPGQVKVVNHIQPAQSPAGAVTLLISNATSPPCCSSSTSTGSESQNRQSAIPGSSTQSTQRHILPAIPTLIYKPNTLIQPGSQVMSNQARTSASKSAKHPAPLPQPPSNQIHKPNWKLLPPRPALKISKGDTGIVLSWNMPLGPEYETIVSYQLFAYQESDSPPSSSMWKRVGDIKALRLPMACTLTQFLTGHKYYFAVRAVDMHSRVGPFSFPSSIALIG